MRALILFLLPAFLTAQNTVCFTVETNPNSGTPGLSGFTKYVNVLDCFEIYAESNVSDAKVLHAAAIAAELLDNNEDGVVDDPLIKSQLQQDQALMPVFAQEGSSAEETFFDNYEGNGASAVLYSTEMDPSQPGHWGDDATVEEIMHTINHVGHTNVYPSVFQTSPNSSEMSDAMDLARGGQFLSIPANYPEEAWYHYDDETCDYDCMAIEYMYWSTVSFMGILDDQNTCDGIANEWELCSPALFENGDTTMYQILTNPAYKIPQNAPDGNYCPEGLGVQKSAPATFEFLGPNPAVNQVKINLNENKRVSIYDFGGRLMVQDVYFQGVNVIDVSGLSNGLYFLKSGSVIEKFIVQH